MLRFNDPAESETMGVLNFPLLNFPMGVLNFRYPAESETMGVLNFPRRGEGRSGFVGNRAVRVCMERENRLNRVKSRVRLCADRIDWL